VAEGGREGKHIYIMLLLGLLEKGGTPLIVLKPTQRRKGKSGRRGSDS